MTVDREPKKSARRHDSAPTSDDSTEETSDSTRRKFLKQAATVAAAGAVYVSPTVAIAQSSSGTFSPTVDEGDPRCRVTVFNVPNGSTGCVNQASGGQRKVGEFFKMDADFTNAFFGQCKCCEYRQSIKGAFTIGGIAVVHMLPGAAGPVAMMAGAFKEDGVVAPPAGINVHYGHRAEGAADPSDVYQNPNRATGCEYRGTDFPGIRLAAGTAYTIDLSFKGEIIDVCNGDVVKRTNTWAVTCAGVA